MPRKGQPSSTLCIMVSNQKFRYVRSALDSAINLNKPDEVFIGLAPSHEKKGWQKLIEQTIKQIRPNQKIKFFIGTNNREKVPVFKFRMYDAVKTKWIINLDDDDVALVAFDLSVVPKNAGFAHGDVLTLCTEKVEFRSPGDVFFRTSKKIECGLHGLFFRGSYYAYRIEAWNQVSLSIDRSYMAYEEWRTVWHMLRVGWKDHYITQVIQLQRVGDYATVAKQAQKAGLSWFKVLELLEQRYRKPIGKTDVGRWWQNWNDSDYVKWIENFWYTEKQTNRRISLYNVLKSLRKSNPDLTQIIDFACGTGMDYPFLISQGYKYKGVDVTKEMLDKFKEKHPEANIEIDDVFNSKFDDNSFQIVLSNALLLHLPTERIAHAQNVLTALKELWRITKNVLVIRQPIVDIYPEDKTKISERFIVTSFRERTLLDMFNRLTPKPRSVVVEGRNNLDANTKDIRIFTLRKK